MASKGDDGMSTDQKVRRSAARTLFDGTVVLVALGVIGGWASTGIYYTQPGEASVVLLLGRYHDTIYDEGMHWRFPVPLGSHDVVNTSEVRRIGFGLDRDEFARADGEAVAIDENEVQTSDSNIVIPRYVVQYRVGDPFTYTYSLMDPTMTLRDAAQAAMREVIGQHGIDEVLQADREGIELAAKATLEQILERYARRDGGKTGFEILSIQLQDIQPPPKVQEAFDDLVAAKQDKDRAVSVAQGDAKEIRERANAKAVELTEGAEAYKEAKVIEASGEAKRFELLLAEYRNAREVTRQRLYYETMEQVMRDVDKFVVERDTVQMLPMLSMPAQGRAGKSTPPPTAAEAKKEAQ